MNGQQTVKVWNLCTCGRPLVGIHERVRGTCLPCHSTAMPDDMRTSINRMLAAAFRQTGPAERDALIDEAMDKLNRDTDTGPDGS